MKRLLLPIGMAACGLALMIASGPASSLAQRQETSVVILQGYQAHDGTGYTGIQVYCSSISSNSVAPPLQMADALAQYLTLGYRVINAEGLTLILARP